MTSAIRAAIGFLILFALYQSAEGVGQRLLGSFEVQAGLMLLCLAAAWPVGRFLLRRGGFRAYALDWSAQAPLWISAGVGLAMIAKLASLAVGLHFGIYAMEPAEPAGAAGLATLILFSMLATFMPSLAEDIVTRGFWWRIARLRGAAFVLGTSLIYVLNHVYRLENGPAEWLMLFCFGLAYAAAVARTGSLWAAVGLHWGWNLTNALVGGLASVESTALAPFVSAAAHLAMAALVVGLPRRNSPWTCPTPEIPGSSAADQTEAPTASAPPGPSSTPRAQSGE